MSTYQIPAGDYTDLAEEAFINMLRGGSSGAGYHPAFIDIGVGGDYNTAGVDTGARFAPVGSETEIRKRLFRANIVYTEVIAGNKLKYVAFVDGHEALSTDINEFALIASNQTMIAHLVLPAAPTRAEKFTKNGATKLFLEWVISVSLNF